MKRQREEKSEVTLITTKNMLSIKVLYILHKASQGLTVFNYVHEFKDFSTLASYEDIKHN
uniref:Uncharacterized protein n=1 Tax=Schistosoma haematobium TaxID=6185 RepID=A0A095C500_SCHHA